MFTTKQRLLAATIIAGVAAPAQAQFSFPSVNLRGAGASAVADINVKTLNCIGANSPLGNSNGTTSPITLTDFIPTAPSASNPTLACSAGDGVDNNIYNGTGVFTGQYVSTGSGFGRTQWSLFTNQFGVGANSAVVNPFGPWGNVQYAFSESPVTSTEYNTTYQANAATPAGAGIQLPLFVVPVSFAYNNQYGVNGAAPLTFRVKTVVKINGVDAGGLKLDKAAYCKIWNGQITNWNNADLKALNGGQDLRDLDDPQARWDSEGVPIRLVGRVDRSGTTDLFTRALAAQCSSLAGNKFAKAAENLPYNAGAATTGAGGSGFDYRNLRSDTQLFPGSAQTRFAGTVESLNGYVYDSVTDKFCLASEVLPATTAPVAPAQCPASVAPLVAGAQTGSFTVANGSGAVEEGIRRADNNLSIASTVTTGVTLNGKFGYIGADFVTPSAGRSLFSAALQIGTSTKYALPDAKNASLAFGAVLPPQTTNKNGAFDTADSRLVYKDVTNLALGTEPVSRANPLHWVNVLYPPSGVSLADPTVGYPVTGASNFLTYTCFSDAAKRSGVANYLGYVTGKLTKKNAIGGTPASIKLSANTFKGTGASALGILAKSNIALPSSAWLTVYAETFLKKSTKASGGVVLGNLNLWIQSKQPAKATDIDQFPDDAVDSNPTCAGKTGA